MTDQPNTLTPDQVNAIVRDMDDPRYPTRITVFCDHCGVEATRDYMVSEDMSKPERLAVARKHLVANEGWERTDNGDDFCPEHAAPKPADGDRPYTDDDLRTEAARQHAAAIRSITPSEIADHMDRGHVLSTQTEDEATRRTWAELLNPDGDDTNEFKAARQQIDDLISRAADLSGWAVDMGGDGLEPADECLSLKGDGKPIVRIHFAFAPTMPDDVRQHVISGVAQAIDAEL